MTAENFRLKKTEDEKKPERLKKAKLDLTRIIQIGELVAAVAVVVSVHYRRGWFSVRFQDYLDGLIQTNPPIEGYLFNDQADPNCV